MVKSISNPNIKRAVHDIRTRVQVLVQLMNSLNIYIREFVNDNSLLSRFPPLFTENVEQNMPRKTRHAEGVISLSRIFTFLLFAV